MCEYAEDCVFPTSISRNKSCLMCLYDKLQHIDALISPPQKVSFALQLPVTFST